MNTKIDKTNKNYHSAEWYMLQTKYKFNEQTIWITESDERKRDLRLGSLDEILHYANENNIKDFRVLRYVESVDIVHCEETV